MTEKRFTLEEFGLNFIVNDNGRNLTAKQTVDRLNNLNDENEELKHECNYLQNRLDDFINIQNENEQLKKIRDAAFELAENPTQHTLWKFRRFLKEYDSEGDVR